MKFFVLLTLVQATVLTTTQTVWAHARWVTPTPRDNSTQYKDENFPCGGQPARAATQAVTTLTPGGTYTLQFEETVTHPGCFLVDFSPGGDTGWLELANVKHVNTPPNPSNQAPRPYSQTVTLPNMTCTDCTLRVRQVMMESRGGEAATCPPSPLGNVPTYFSCANIVLAGSGAASPGTAGAPGSAMGVIPTSPDSVGSVGCSVATGRGAPVRGLAGSFLVGTLLILASRLRSVRPRRKRG